MDLSSIQARSHQLTWRDTKLLHLPHLSHRAFRQVGLQLPGLILVRSGIIRQPLFEFFHSRLLRAQKNTIPFILSSQFFGNPFLVKATCLSLPASRPVGKGGVVAFT